MHSILRLYEDLLPGGAQGIALPPLPRMIFVVRGTLTVGGRVFAEGEVWHGEGEVTVGFTSAEGGLANAGATCWRFELVPADVPDGALSGDGVRSSLKLAAPLATLPVGNL